MHVADKIECKPLLPPRHKETVCGISWWRIGRYRCTDPGDTVCTYKPTLCQSLLLEPFRLARKNQKTCRKCPRSCDWPLEPFRQTRCFTELAGKVEETREVAIDTEFNCWIEKRGKILRIKALANIFFSFSYKIIILHHWRLFGI